MFARFKEFFKRSSAGNNEKSDDDSSDARPLDGVNINSDSSPSDNAAVAVPVPVEEATVVYPTGRNEMASSAITSKLTEIAEVAEALDSALRDTQNGLDLVEMNSSASDKKAERNHNHHQQQNNHHHHHNGSNTEDWHSRSTEDESFATASEGNFTPHSHSSSFQTASEGPSFLSSGKTSFDSSDLEDSTSQIFPLDMLSPGNISFDGSSEPSFVSAQQSLTTSPQSMPHDSGIDSTSEFKSIAEEKANQNNDDDDEDNNHSRSTTPTPGNVSAFNNVASEATTTTTTSFDDDDGVGAAAANVDADEVSASVCSTKPTDSWRSKYYGHVTKQTIKGCL